MALRERCEDMEKWQQRSRKEKEFLTCRFQEAKALVERLSQEKQDLWSQLNQTDPRAQAGSPTLQQRNDLNCLEVRLPGIFSDNHTDTFPPLSE